MGLFGTNVKETGKFHFISSIRCVNELHLILLIQNELFLWMGESQSISWAFHLADNIGPVNLRPIFFRSERGISSLLQFPQNF